MKGFIYVLFNKNGNYIGSTFNIYDRIKEHQHSYNKWINGTRQHKCKSFEIVKDKFEYEIIEEINVNNKNELFQWEQYYMDKWECINEKKAYQSIEERNQYLKIYRDEHKEHYKNYRDEHKEEMKEYGKKRYENNKEEILKNQSKKIICECGIEITKGKLSRHKKSKRHQLKLKTVLF
jgi:hypothetical protein